MNIEIPNTTKKQRKYYENNREAWNKYQREYKKRKYAEDLSYRLRVKEYIKEYKKNKIQSVNA